MIKQDIALCYFIHFKIVLVLYHTTILYLHNTCLNVSYSLHFNILSSRLYITKQLILVTSYVIYKFKSIIYQRLANKIRDSVNVARWPPRTRHVLEKKNYVDSSINFFLKWLSNTHPFYWNLDVKSASIKKIRYEVIPIIIVTLICVIQL